MTPLPSLDRTSPSFKSDTDAFFGTQLPQFSVEVDALQADVTTKQGIASAAATTATAQAGIATAQAGIATTKAGEALSSANDAAAFAATALSSPGTNATSTTSLAIGSGSKTLTIQTGKSLPVGQWLTYADAAAPAANSMNGQCTAHNTATGVITIFVPDSGVKGSGTISNWVVSQSGAPGAAGVASPAMNIFMYNNF